PFSVQPGDQVIVTGNIVSFIRNGQVVGTRTMSAVTTVPHGATQAESISNVYFFRVFPMAGISETLENVTVAENGETVYFHFSSSAILEFSSWAAALASVQHLDTDPTTAQNMLVLGSCRQYATNGNNIRSLCGMKCSINGAAQRPVTID
ncbi:MAG: hypothetical protein ACKO0Z_17430, partial [Betaproteobacteria bacterium]